MSEKLEPMPDADGHGGAFRILVRTLRLWFGFEKAVSQPVYAATGFGLTAVKYTIEAIVLWTVCGVIFSPIDFLNPVLSAREDMVSEAPQWLAWAWFLWTLPFLWIAVTMSVRRSLDAGATPWLGLLVLVPLANLLVMLVLALAPTRQPSVDKAPKKPASEMSALFSAVVGVAAGLLIALVMLGVSVFAFEVYGASLFLGTPVLMGTVAGVIYNLSGARGAADSIGLGVLTTVLAGAVFLMFAIEGAICLIMAAPIVLPLGGLGGLLGKVIADTTRRPLLGAMIVATVFLPGWSGLESVATPKRTFMVMTAIDIDAPIDQVWENVIYFPDLPEPEEWYFRWGIACPIRAHIEGHGVGALRHCVFTTGTFVEPITAWEAPTRLAFDVREQPAPMFELSPYRHLHPPHLDGSLRSTRGEFRLVRLDDNRTRLEGRTWYELDLFPSSYWTLWSDMIIHRIHDRVLEHVRRNAEHP